MPRWLVQGCECVCSGKDGGILEEVIWKIASEPSEQWVQAGSWRHKGSIPKRGNRKPKCEYEAFLGQNNKFEFREVMDIRQESSIHSRTSRLF